MYSKQPNLPFYTYLDISEHMWQIGATLAIRIGPLLSIIIVNKMRHMQLQAHDNLKVLQWLCANESCILIYIIGYYIHALSLQVFIYS